MKSYIINSIILAVALLTASPAGAVTKPTSAHAKAHREQLAGVGKMDKSTIRSMIQEEIEEREEANALSAETGMMLGDLIKEANRHIGKRYVRGAKGPSQFDCSGFSSYVYRQFGYNLSPSSRDQYKQGTAVNRKDLRKGDLVFFTSRSSGNGVGHVGIVVDANSETGDFTFIHASIKGVKIDSCKGYYAGRYIGARRVIND